MDVKGIFEKSIVGIVSAVVLGALALLWNWGSQGGLVRILGGVTPKEVQDEIGKRLTVNLGLPAGTVIGFDDPAGCTKLGGGWRDANFIGKVLVGAGGNDPRWEYRKSAGAYKITVGPRNIPPLYLGYHTQQSGPGVTLSMVEQLSFDKPKSPQILQTSTDPADPIDIMPPYVPIYFCKQTM